MIQRFFTHFFWFCRVRPVWLALLACGMGTGFAQGQDSLGVGTVLLDSVTVLGFEGNKRLMATPGAIGKVGQARLQGYDGTSVVFAANTIPGLRFEERSPGSYRVAIRGSSLRSPFGVRNVKVYWNGIPYTRPTGETPLNHLDAIGYGTLEAIRGPAGSIYGAGNGGVLNINTTPLAPTNQFGVGATVGSFGMRRYTVQANKAGENGGVSLGYARHRADGYRENSALARDNLVLGGQVGLAEGQRMAWHMLYTRVEYGIPGGLTAEQRDENPKQLRPNLAGRDTGLSSENLLFGTTYHLNPLPWLESATTVYGNLEAFENTFIDFRRERRLSGGGRTRFATAFGGSDARMKLIWGAEYQRGQDVARNFANNGGQPGGLNFDDELGTIQYSFFAKAEATLARRWHLTLGLSRNAVSYEIDRLVDTGLDSAYNIARDFEPQWVPRVGVAWEMAPGVAAHASVSQGFSPPVIEEIRTNEGSVNTGLQPEKGTNYEAGLRALAWKSKLAVDASAFFFRLDDTIVQEETARGTVVFNNAGNTRQFGVEAQATWYVLAQHAGRVKDLTLSVAYTYHNFSFGDYVDGGEDFSGNDLPGVSPHTLVATLDLRLRTGWWLGATYNKVGRMPLNDENTVHADRFGLLLLKAGYQWQWKDTRLSVFAGINNLTDTAYSLGNDVNAFGSRYFQPAAERNYYGGLSVGLGD